MEEVFAPVDNKGPKTVRVLMAHVEPKRANALVKRLHTLLPTPEANLGHLKRVRRDRKTGALAAILSTPDRYAALEEKARSELEGDFGLTPQEAEVPRLPAASREEHEEMAALWPMTYHVVVEVIRKEEAALTSEEMQTAERYLQAAIDDALALSSPFSSPAAPEEEQAPPPRRLHGAVIVNPANDAVIVTASAVRASLRASGKGTADHPLQHCVMLCVDGVAGIVAPTDPSSVHSSLLDTDDGLRSRLPEDQYVCTGLDAYLTHEPCVMCAMALVHSRIRRVFYCLPGPRDGALGTHFHLHALPSLNHRYRAFKALPSMAKACAAAVEGEGTG